MTRFFILLIIIFSACQNPNKERGGWQKVFQNDANGNVTYGHKSTLMDAVRLGYPIRIGFGSNRIEHVADADFLTIIDDKEVFAQIRTIIGQAPAIENDSIKMRFRAQNHWTKISGTNGYSIGFMTNYFNDTLAGGGEDRYRPTTWYALYPNHNLNIKATPLWQKAPPNWEATK